MASLNSDTPLKMGFFDNFGRDFARGFAMPFQAIAHTVVEPVGSAIDHGVGFVAGGIAEPFGGHVSQTPLGDAIHDMADPDHPLNQAIHTVTEPVKHAMVYAADHGALMTALNATSDMTGGATGHVADTLHGATEFATDVIVPNDALDVAITAASFGVGKAAKTATKTVINATEKASVKAATSRAVTVGAETEMRAGASKAVGGAVTKQIDNKVLKKTVAAEASEFEASAVAKVAEKEAGGALTTVEKNLAKLEGKAVSKAEKYGRRVGAAANVVSGVSLGLAAAPLYEQDMDEWEEPDEYDEWGDDRTAPYTTPYQTEGHNAEEAHQADLAAAAAPPPVRLGAPEPMHAHQSGLEQFRYLLIGGLAAATIAITAYQGFRLQREIARA